MKRKLVKQGTATMMISLPSKWIKENNLTKGSEIEIIEKNNVLTLGTSLVEKREIIIPITKENRDEIKNLLTHAYRKGLDKIILKGEINSVREIRNLVKDLLIGFEVIQINSNEVIIENISEPKEQKYEVMLKKVFDLTKDTTEIIYKDYKQNKMDNFEEIEDIKNLQERFILYCRRLLNKGDTQKNKILHWELLTFLLHIEHKSYYLYEFMKDKKLTPNKDILSLLEELKNSFEDYYNSYFKKNIKLINKINQTKIKYYLGSIPKLLEKSSGTSTIILSDIRELFRLIQIGTSPILSIILED